jgi:hypothetical protein
MFGSKEARVHLHTHTLRHTHTHTHTHTHVHAVLAPSVAMSTTRECGNHCTSKEPIKEARCPAVIQLVGETHSTLRQCVSLSFHLDHAAVIMTHRQCVAMPSHFDMFRLTDTDVHLCASHLSPPCSGLMAVLHHVFRNFQRPQLHVLAPTTLA